MTDSTWYRHLSDRITHLSWGEIAFLILASIQQAWPGYSDIPELINWTTFAIPAAGLVVSWLAILFGYRLSPILCLTILVLTDALLFWSNTTIGFFFVLAWFAFRVFLDNRKPILWLGLMTIPVGTIIYYLTGVSLTGPGLLALLNSAAIIVGALFGLGGMRMRRRFEKRADQQRDAQMLAYREQTLRNIHDTVSPALAGIGLQAELGATSDLSEEEMRNVLTKIGTDVRSSHQRLRRALDSLRFGDSFTTQTLSDLIRDARIDGLTVTGDWELNIESPTTKALTCRTIAELLANAKRYAQGSTIDLRITKTDEHLLLEAQNPTEQPLSQAGHGLTNLAHLLESSGGSLTWRLSDNIFTATAEVPLLDDREETS